MTGKTAMIPLFLNLLSLIAPTLWVLGSGALGIGIGAYGPRLLKRLKHDRPSRSANSNNATALPQRGAARRTGGPRKTKPRSAASGARRKRPAAR